ncbi:MAG: Ig-like domain-containing protein [Muribaculaceae bacterium]|nr:Ig-like domain-containing protein [Muribaculaceae bacterium]
MSIGEATIKVTTEPVEGEYLAGEGTIKVTVVGKKPEMSFTNPSVYGKVNTGVVWQQVAVTEPASDRGAITYTSSDPEVVSVDASTGQIRPADVKKAGVATITATMAANGDYAEGTAEYLIVVIDPDASIEPGETLFDFTTKDPYGFTSKTDSSYETEVKAIAGENETVTITFEGKYRSYYGNNAYSLRLAKKNDANPNKFTISVPDGYKITKVGITSSDGTVSINGTTLTKSNREIVWEADNNVITNSVEFVSSGSNTLVISKINVMWDAADSDLEPAHLTFTPNVNGIYVDEVAEINAVNNPKGRTVTYSIAGLNEDEYDIEQVEDKLHVLVNKPGSYTLEARSEAGDGFRDGFAIMRLNVYRHLSVYADEVLLDKDEVDTDTEKFITIDVPENANLYYCFASESTPAADETADENQLAGYTLYEDGITVPAKTTGTLNFYIANYGYLSPIRKISLGFETGIEEIGAETTTGTARLFDLNGREIKGTPDKGIYIRIKDGKAAKIMIK